MNLKEAYIAAREAADKAFAKVDNAYGTYCDPEEEKDIAGISFDNALRNFTYNQRVAENAYKAAKDAGFTFEDDDLDSVILDFVVKESEENE